MKEKIIAIVLLVVLVVGFIVCDIATTSPKEADNISSIMSANRELKNLIYQQTMIQNQILGLQKRDNHQNQLSDTLANLTSILSLINQGLNNLEQTEALLNKMLKSTHWLLETEKPSKETVSLFLGTKQVGKNILSAVAIQKENLKWEQGVIKALLKKDKDLLLPNDLLFVVLDQSNEQMILQQLLINEILNQQIPLMKFAMLKYLWFPAQEVVEV